MIPIAIVQARASLDLYPLNNVVEHQDYINLCAMITYVDERGKQCIESHVGVDLTTLRGFVEIALYRSELVQVVVMFGEVIFSHDYRDDLYDEDGNYLGVSDS